MKVIIQNNQVQAAAKFLFDLKLKAKNSRQRTKLVKILAKRTEEMTEQERELLKEHCELDKNGEPLKSKDGTGYQPKDMKGFIRDQKELFDEELIIEGGDNREMIRTVRKILEELDEELSGKEAAIYEYLYEQFEKESE